MRRGGKDKQVIVEPAFPKEVAQALEKKGHHIKVALDSGTFGRGQVILRDQQNRGFSWRHRITYRWGDRCLVEREKGDTT